MRKLQTQGKILKEKQNIIEFEGDGLCFDFDEVIKFRKPQKITS